MIEQAEKQIMLKTKRINKGSWETVEWFLNASGTGFFKAPAGASIKVRYGVGALGKDRQKQVLNGSDLKTLKVGPPFSLSRARMQIKVSQTTDVTYDIYAGGGPFPVTPEIPF